MSDINKLNDKLEKYDLKVYQRDNKYHRDYMNMFSSNGTFELVSTKEYDKFRKGLFEFSEGTPSLVHENFINLNNREDSLVLPHKAMFKKLEEHEDDLNCFVKFMDYIDASDDEKFKDCKFEVKTDLGIGVYSENDFGITMYPYVDSEDGKTKCNFIVGKNLYQFGFEDELFKSLETDDNKYNIDTLLGVKKSERNNKIDCSRYDNDKLGSVLEINEESLNYIPELYAYDMHCYNNILFTKEIDIENINLDFLDEAIKITNENDFVESRRHFYENKNYEGLLKHYAENNIIDKDNYYKLVAERAIFDSNAFLRNKEADYLAAKDNVVIKEQELDDAKNDLKIKEQEFINAVNSINNKEQDNGIVR